MGLQTLGVRPLRRGARDIDKNIMAFDPRRVDRQRAVARIDPLAGAEVELPQVRAAGKYVFVEFAMQQRKFLVRTFILQGAHFAAGQDRKQNLGTAHGFKAAHLAFPDIIKRADFFEGHVPAPSGPRISQPPFRRGTGLSRRLSCRAEKDPACDAYARE